jgi:membrane protein DedA with SNARE-associated domain
LFDWITHLVGGSPWTYAVVFAVAAADVILPLLPSETVVLTASILAARGVLSLWLIVPLAALGAFAGDNLCFWLGRRVGEPVARRLFRDEKGRDRLRWAERAIGRHGALLIVVGRFLPGGRTASTFAAGLSGFEYRRFLVADAIAALAWALYASLLGYLGGASFQHGLWKPLALAAGVALLVGLAIEGYRRLQRRRGRDVLGDPIGPAGSPRRR